MKVTTFVLLPVKKPLLLKSKHPYQTYLLKKKTLIQSCFDSMEIITSGIELAIWILSFTIHVTNIHSVLTSDVY